MATRFAIAAGCLAAAIALIGGSVAFAPVQPAKIAESRFSSSPQTDRWGKNYLPNLPVIDQDGNRYNFYDDLIKGRKVVINFIFASCTDICPLTTARMAMLQDKLKDIVGSDVFMYTITIEPEKDGPKELKAYANAFHIGPGWRFLTGKPADIQLIRDRLGERSRIKTEHRHEMLLGNESIGDWSKDSAYGDLDRVALNVRALDPNYRLDQDHGAIKQASAEMIEVSQKPGEALFTKACSSCHTIGKGDRAGPDLRDVQTRRNRDWLTRFITRPDRMIAQGDPVALELVAKFPAIKMPNLGLSEVDAADVLAFIEAQSYAVNSLASTPKTASGHHHHHH
jgi:protein SCO1